MNRALIETVVLLVYGSPSPGKDVYIVLSLAKGKMHNAVIDEHNMTVLIFLHHMLLFFFVASADVIANHDPEFAMIQGLIPLYASLLNIVSFYLCVLHGEVLHTSRPPIE